MTRDQLRVMTYMATDPSRRPIPSALRHGMAKPAAECIAQGWADTLPDGTCRINAYGYLAIAQHMQRQARRLLEKAPPSIHGVTPHAET